MGFLAGLAGVGGLLSGIGALKSKNPQPVPSVNDGQDEAGSTLSTGGQWTPLFTGLHTAGNIANTLSNTKSALDGLSGSKTPSGAELGSRRRDFLNAAYPGTTPWEQLGATGQGQATDAPRLQRRRLQQEERIVDKQLATQKEVANIQADATIKAAGTQPLATSNLQKNQGQLARWQAELAKANIDKSHQEVIALKIKSKLDETNIYKIEQELPYDIKQTIANTKNADEKTRLLKYGSLYTTIATTAEEMGIEPHQAFAAIATLGGLGIGGGLFKVIGNIFSHKKGKKIGIEKGKKEGKIEADKRTAKRTKAFFDAVGTRKKYYQDMGKGEAEAWKDAMWDTIKALEK